MLFIKRLKIGDIVEIDREGYIIFPNRDVFYLMNCTPGSKEQVTPGSVFTYLGIHHETMNFSKRHTKSGRKRKNPKQIIRRFHSCLFDSKIVLISEYTLKNFNKIQYKKEK